MSTTAWAEVFGLNLIETEAANFHESGAPHQPDADWNLRWGIYTLAPGAPHRVGTLRLSRSRLDNDEARLLVRREQLGLNGQALHVEADIRFRPEPLARPLAWTCSARQGVARAEAPVPLTLEREGRWDGKTLRLGRREIPIDTPATLNWLLFESVPRLPRQAAEPLAFTLIDHFDQPKPDQRLAWSRRVELPPPGGQGESLRLDCFDQLGRGIVPWTYWVDAQGRTRFAVSGIEAYLLEDETTPNHEEGEQ